MPFGSYSTPPLVTNVNTAATEGTLPPFPENDEITDDTNRLTPSWKRWFSTQRKWLSTRGGYTPTDIAFTNAGGAAAVFGTPVFQWWKQGNMVNVYLDIQFSGITLGTGYVIIKPLPFDPSTKILQTGRSTVPLYTLSCIAGTAATNPVSVGAFAYNGKGASLGTYIAIYLPVSTTYAHVNGFYITDN